MNGILDVYGYCVGVFEWYVLHASRSASWVSEYGQVSEVAGTDLRYWNSTLFWSIGNTETCATTRHPAGCVKRPLCVAGQSEGRAVYAWPITGDGWWAPANRRRRGAFYTRRVWPLVMCVGVERLRRVLTCPDYWKWTT